MDFELNEEQKLLADSVRKYLASSYDFESRKKTIASPTGFSQPAWTMLSDMGLNAIPFAPSAGGFYGCTACRSSSRWPTSGSPAMCW